MGEYLSGAFEKFSEWNGYILSAIVLLLLFAIGMYFAGRKVKWDTRMLASAAMCIALTYVLSQIRLFSMPQGGSITPGSVLPIMLFSMAYGVWPGFLAGALCGLLGLLQSAYVIHPIQMLLDYPLAMAAVGLGAIVRNKYSLGIFRLPVALLIAFIGRYICSVISGVVFFAEYAGDMNVWVYSLSYNATYMGPEALVAIALAFIPKVAALEGVIKGADKRLRNA